MGDGPGDAHRAARSSSKEQERRTKILETMGGIPEDSARSIAFWSMQEPRMVGSVTQLVKELAEREKMFCDALNAIFQNLEEI